MTKSTITRERVVALIAEHSYDSALVDALEHLLAAMDSEPVAEVYQAPNVGICATLGPSIRMLYPLEPGTKLYRYAQPVPVVMDDTKLRELFDSWFASDCSFDLSPEASEADNIAWRESYWYVWQRCRAAMLQELKKSAGTEAICRSDENVQVLHTKSPAQSDCCPAQNSVTPAQNQGWIPVSERMPEVGDIVLTAMGGVVNVGETECSAANCRFFTSVISGRELPATHWMPLPAAPQEVK